jgi:hypothetical protein
MPHADATLAARRAVALVGYVVDGWLLCCGAVPDLAARLQAAGL